MPPAFKYLRNRLLLLSALILIVAGLWAVWWEPSSLQVVKLSVTLADWHPEHSGLRVAVMSDLHIGSPYTGVAKLRHIVEVTNSEKPDLVLLLGDYVIKGVVGGTFVTPEPIAAELKSLRAPLGVVAVLGNHDWHFDGWRIRWALEKSGVRVLDDENLRIDFRGRAFWLSGLGDLWTKGEHIAPTLARIEGQDPVLVLMHNPDVFPRIPGRVSLSLAGHTHGGQVDLPLFGRLVVPSRFGQRYAYGLIEEGGRKLLVTGGIGTSIIPVRFGVRPEVVILTLLAADR